MRLRNITLALVLAVAAMNVAPTPVAAEPYCIEADCAYYAGFACFWNQIPECLAYGGCLDVAYSTCQNEDTCVAGFICGPRN